MAVQEILVLAVSKMLGGVCVAGMTSTHHPVTVLQWVRPVREHEHVLLGDVTTPERAILRPFDVCAFSLLRPNPSPPHVEDWITDFRHRSRIVRHLDGQRRHEFLENHLDRAPNEVLEDQLRSLCLIKPDWIRGSFRLDGYTGQFDARLAFGLGLGQYAGSHSKGGLSVTDLRWRALGRANLSVMDGPTAFDGGDLEARFGIKQIYLTVGLTRPFQGRSWPIVVGVHTIPEIEAHLDHDNL